MADLPRDALGQEVDKAGIYRLLIGAAFSEPHQWAGRAGTRLLGAHDAVWRNSWAWVPDATDDQTAAQLVEAMHQPT